MCGVAAVAGSMIRLRAPRFGGLEPFLRDIQDTCDVWLAEYYHRAIFLLLGGVSLFTAARGYQLASDWEQWSVGEWLISYTAGFVRRGLSGELLLAASERTGVAANLLVFATTLSLSVAFFILLAQLLRRKQITFWYLFLCLSPASLLFTLHNPAAVGRQELLVYVAFALWALAWNRGVPSRLALMGFAVFAFAATLVHELFFLFTPYFALLPFLLSTRRDGMPRVNESLIVPVGSFAAVLAIVLFSGSLDATALCERVMRAGAPAKVCTGIFEYGDPRISSGLLEFAGHFNGHTLVGLLLVFPIVLLPVGLFVVANEGRATSGSQLIATFCGFVLFSAPLFVLAVDWGRWISIHAVVTTVTCASLLPDRASAAVRAPVLRPGVGRRLAVGLLVLSSTLLWSVNYCCGDEYFNSLGPIHALRQHLRQVGV